MEDTVTKVLSQSKSQKYFFITAGAVLTGLAAWMFLFRNGLPDQLLTMWASTCAFIAAGWESGINKAESMLNKDLDKDGDIGVASQGVSANIAPTQQVASNAVYIPQEVASYDAECDASKYNLC